MLCFGPDLAGQDQSKQQVNAKLETYRPIVRTIGERSSLAKLFSHALSYVENIILSPRLLQRQASSPPHIIIQMLVPAL